MKDIDRSVVIPVEHKPAFGTVMGAGAQVFWDTSSTPRAILGGASGIDHNDRPTSAFSLVGNHPAQFTPSSQMDLATKVPVRAGDHGSDIQVFDDNRVVFIDQLSRDAVQHGLPCSGEVEPSACYDLPCLAAPIRSQFLARDIFLGFPQTPFSMSGRAGVAKSVAIRSSDEVLDAQIDANLSVGGLEWFGGDLGADEVGIPSISPSDNPDALGFAGQDAVCLDFHPTDASDRESRVIVIVLPARVPEFQCSESVSTLESGEPRLFTSLYLAEEELKRTVKSSDSGIEKVGVYGLELREFASEGSDLLGLVEVGNELAATLVGSDALFQCSIVEVTAPVEHRAQDGDLSLGGVDAELVCARQHVDIL